MVTWQRSQNLHYTKGRFTLMVITGTTMFYLQVKPLQLNWRSSTRSKVKSTYAPFPNKLYGRDLTVCQVTRVASKWLPAEIPRSCHYNDVIMSAMASQITSLTSVYSTVYSGIKAPRHCLSEGNSPLTGEFPAQRASNEEDASIRWHHHVRHGFYTNPSHFTRNFVDKMIWGHTLGRQMYLPSLNYD